MRATENWPPSHLTLDCPPVCFWIFCWFSRERTEKKKEGGGEGGGGDSQPI